MSRINNEIAAEANRNASVAFFHRDQMIRNLLSEIKNTDLKKWILIDKMALLC